MHQPQERRNLRNQKLYFSNGLVQIIFLLLGLPFLGISIAFYFSMHDALEEEALILILVFGGIGLLFLLTVVALSVWNVKEKRRIRQLKENGRRRYAPVTEVAMNYSVTINNRTPYVLYCQIQEGQQAYIFKSKLLRIDPTPFLSSDVVVVYQELDNPKNYFVDVEESMAVTVNFL